MTNCSKYIADCKEVLNDPRMSDRELGERLARPNGDRPWSQQTIALAKTGQMSDALAIVVGKLLEKHEKVAHAGEVMLVAHAERKSGAARATLLDYAKKVLAALPANALKTLVGPVVAAVALSLQVPDAHASVGGAGGKRT